MSKNVTGILVLVGIWALSLFLISCGSSSSRPSGVLYVLTEGSSGFGNNVSSFAVDLNTGGLSYVNSNASTCPTAASQQNPEPCGAPLSIVLDPTGGNAYVLNQGTPCNPQNGSCQGSNSPILPTMIPFTVNSDGSLSSPGSPVYWTCVVTPAASCTANNSAADIAQAMVGDAAGKFLFVIDQGLYPQPATCPQFAAPVQSPADAANFAGCPSISVLAVSSGALTAVNQGTTYQSPLFVSKIPSALSAIAYTPQGGSATELLFVTNTQDLFPNEHNDNTVSVYQVSSSGVLSETANSPYAIAEPNPISVMSVNTSSATAGNNSGGVFAIVGNEDVNGGHLNPFQVCTSVQVGSCTQQNVTDSLLFPVTCPGQASCSVSPGENPIQMVVDPTNNFIYVVSELQNAVYGYSIGSSTGKLTALSPASQSTGSQPVSLALHPSVNNGGQFLFVSNSNSNNISAFTLNTTTGSMSSLPTVVTPATPSGIAVH